jgi:hypothetical protein
MPEFHIEIDESFRGRILDPVVLNVNKNSQSGKPIPVIRHIRMEANFEGRIPDLSDRTSWRLCKGW